MDAQIDGSRRFGGRPPVASHATPSLFDCNERLAQALRSRHVGDHWIAEVEAKLHAYRACLQRHVLAADGERGWIAELRGDEPRIEPLARRARADFAQLDTQVAAAMASLRRPTSMPREVRHDLRQLVELTRRHRARCARLVHEAFVIDLGVG